MDKLNTEVIKFGICQFNPLKNIKLPVTIKHYTDATDNTEVRYKVNYT
jgi:hypothetical protein